jgi:hypothetical protein
MPSNATLGSAFSLMFLSIVKDFVHIIVLAADCW